MDACAIAVIGGGPAGMMAAIAAGRLKKDVWLIEKGGSLGRKLLLSGKERCNVTNTASPDDFIAQFGRQGDFLRTAFSRFSNQDLMDFFRAKGLEVKVERQGRVFPATDMASSVVEALKEYLRESKVTISYNTRVAAIKKERDIFSLSASGTGVQKLSARKVILAAGGASFSFTGSSGDGFIMAEKLGHTLVPLVPGLVPLKVKEPWVKELSGLKLKNIRFTIRAGNKKITSDIGELSFAPFGISGALVLDLSNTVLGLLKEEKEVILGIDLKPGLNHSQLENRLVRDFAASGNKKLIDVLKDFLPQRLIGVFVKLWGFDYRKKANQITKQERALIVKLLKSIELRVSGSLPVEEAMVTHGGVSLSEINPRTMESKIVPGLYFAGETIDASAASGGYNLQQAFSTGYLAGASAVESLGV